MNKIRYICNDRSISVEAEDVPSNKRIVVTIRVNNKPAWQFSFRMSLGQDGNMLEVLNSKAAYACRKLAAMSKWDAEELCEADKMMICVYAWRNLKEVRTKLGTLVWQR